MIEELNSAADHLDHPHETKHSERISVPTMVEITIFEEAMCCSTGVCGPDPDEELVAFTHTVDKLEETFSDLEITRANMSSDMDRFLEHEGVADDVQSKGPDVLPITVVDGEIVDRSEYPSYESIAELIEERRTQEA